jgi:hypothetical protein
MDNDHAAPPVACSLGQADLAQRAQRWKALAASSLTDLSQTGSGLRLAFGNGPGVADELQELVALERECCAFATWFVRQDGGEVVLEVSGDSEEAAGAVRSMFSALGSRARAGRVRRAGDRPLLSPAAARSAAAAALAARRSAG